MSNIVLTSYIGGSPLFLLQHLDTPKNPDVRGHFILELCGGRKRAGYENEASLSNPSTPRANQTPNEPLGLSPRFLRSQRACIASDNLQMGTRDGNAQNIPFNRIKRNFSCAFRLLSEINLLPSQSKAGSDPANSFIQSEPAIL